MRKANAAISILGFGLALLLAWAPTAGADTYTYTYNAADQLAGVQGPNGAASYTYDGDGQRITKTTAAGQTIYVRDPHGEVIAEYSGTTGALLAEYVYVDGQRLCKITHDAQGVERRVYYHQDVVGTPVAETNESGQVLVRANYTPFGEEVIPGAAPDPHKFTGKELDDESGLYYFGARYYDAHLGRFVSVDPSRGKEEDPQSWNRYAYALNNPLRYFDPDGEAALVFTVGPGSGVSGMAGHSALYVMRNGATAGVSYGGNFGFSKGAVAFVRAYNAEGRTVVMTVLNTTPEQDKAMMKFLQPPNQEAGTNPNALGATLMVRENCAQAVGNTLEVGGLFPAGSNPSQILGGALSVPSALMTNVAESNLAAATAVFPATGSPATDFLLGVLQMLDPATANQLPPPQTKVGGGTPGVQ
jgi:RHS repeat-associated protein